MPSVSWPQIQVVAERSCSVSTALAWKLFHDTEILNYFLNTDKAQSGSEAMVEMAILMKQIFSIPFQDFN